MMQKQKKKETKHMKRFRDNLYTAVGFILVGVVLCAAVGFLFLDTILKAMGS